MRRGERILVRQVNWLGDLVMTTPATWALRQRFPEAHIAVLVRRELAGFYDGADWIDEVISFEQRSGLAGLIALARSAKRLSEGSFDVAVVFPRSFSSALSVALAGIPRRVGYSGDARGWLLTDRFRRSPELLTQHQFHEHHALVQEAFGFSGAPPDPILPVSVAHVEAMRAWLEQRRRRNGPLVALAAAAAYGPAKEWPAERFSELIDRLARLGIETVLIGSPGEAARSRTIAESCEFPALVAAGETSVGELIALLSLCAGFVGNDSGAMHVAAALGVPTIGIFGSTRSDRTGPLGRRAEVLQHPIACSPCLQRTCRFGHYDCLRSVLVDEVLARLEPLLVQT